MFALYLLVKCTHYVSLQLGEFANWVLQILCFIFIYLLFLVNKISMLNSCHCTCGFVYFNLINFYFVYFETAVQI